MPPLTDPDRRRAYLAALANWTVTGYVVFHEKAERWLRNEFSDLTVREIKRLLHEHVGGSGANVDEQIETREQWRGLFEYHHDLRVLIRGRLIYFETLLNDRNTTGPEITVVNIHDA